jgi:hypothetical protein
MERALGAGLVFGPDVIFDFRLAKSCPTGGADRGGGNGPIGFGSFQNAPGRVLSETAGAREPKRLCRLIPFRGSGIWGQHRRVKTFFASS